MDGDAEGARLEVEERHLDRRCCLRHAAGGPIHSGQGGVDVERVGAGQRRGQTAHGRVHVVG